MTPKQKLENLAKSMRSAAARFDKDPGHRPGDTLRDFASRLEQWIRDYESADD